MSKPDTKTCTKCSVEKPLTDFYKYAADKWHGSCKECMKARTGAYQKANREKARKWQKAWRERNPDKEREKQRAWRHGKGREKYLAKRKRYREVHKANLAAEWATYYEANADKLKAKAAANYDPAKKRESRKPGQARLDRERRRARLINAYVEDTPFDKVLQRDEGICGICHKPIMDNRIELDHIIPLAAGGTHEMKNVQIAHRACNRRKWNIVGFTLDEAA